MLHVLAVIVGGLFGTHYPVIIVDFELFILLSVTIISENILVW